MTICACRAQVIVRGPREDQFLIRTVESSTNMASLLASQGRVRFTTYEQKETKSEEKLEIH